MTVFGDSTVKDKTIVVRIGLILILCLIGMFFPVLFIVAAWLGWTIYDTLQNPPPPPPDEWYARRWTTTAADPRWRSDFLAFCESPAETKFLEAMIDAHGLTPDKGVLKGSGLTLDLQVTVNPYRLDFLANTWLVVEIDGAAYHSSPEAVASDKKRDEFLRTQGYAVLRIPAKVVFATPEEAVFRVRTAIAAGRTSLNSVVTERTPQAGVELGSRTAEQCSRRTTTRLTLESFSSAPALNKLGMMHLEGKGVQQSDSEAVRLWRLAADKGDASAQINLAMMYRDGRGVQQSDSETARLLRLAVDQGNAIAQNNLATMYRDGRGVQQSDSEAVRLWRLVADKGDAHAQVFLSKMYQDGRGVSQSDSEAARLLRLAADQGNAIAQNNLATMHSDGKGVQQSDSEAVRLWRLVADKGNADAQLNLAMMYWYGRGVQQSDSEAARLCRLAADQGNAIAQNNLATMYRDGRGVPQSNTEAARFFRLAADQGIESAQNNLGIIEARLHPTLAKPQRVKLSELLASLQLPASTADAPPLIPTQAVVASTLHRPHIQAQAAEQGIRHLIHFTRVANLESIMYHGLLSVQTAHQQGVVPLANDQLRLDGHKDAISLSIGFPNSAMFYKYRQLHPQDRWVVLLLRPEILWTHDCAYCLHNAADKRISSRPWSEFTSDEAFQSMFAEAPDGAPSRTVQRLGLSDPTDVQAEVLVRGNIDSSMLVEMVFEHPDDLEAHRHHTVDRVARVVQVPGSDFFASRRFARNGGVG